MAIVRAQVAIQKTSLNPEDAVVNTWHFKVPAPQTTNYNPIILALQDFYTAISIRMSTMVATAAVHRVKFYDLTDPEPRQPLDETTMDFGTTRGTNALPDEVAICLSYHAQPQSGVAAARRRGRVFLGPWGTSVVTTTTPVAMVHSDTRDMIAAAASQFLADITATGDGTWVLYSPTTAGANEGVDSAGFNVIGGHIDNAFDTIRSRGVDSTVRTYWI